MISIKTTEPYITHLKTINEILQTILQNIRVGFTLSK